MEDAEDASIDIDVAEGAVDGAAGDADATDNADEVAAGAAGATINMVVDWMQ